MRNEIQNIIKESEPESFAQIKGARENHSISGKVLFYPIWNGTLVVAEICGLPFKKTDCNGRFFGFHIHEGSSCKDDKTEPFEAAMGHFNPKNCPHPYHKGDLPVLVGNSGYTFSIFFTDRFTPEEIVGRTIVIHDMPDDFKSQPSGDSGTKIACGEIKFFQ
ncbi:MAG: superoxide dismutase family protein [Eubacteriales bacterium]|nr:superoxide dismutase family protein [Eubacteriales bacterium]